MAFALPYPATWVPVHTCLYQLSPLFTATLLCPLLSSICPPSPALAEQFDPQMCTGCCYCRQNTSRKKRLCCPWDLCALPVRSCHLKYDTAWLPSLLLGSKTCCVLNVTVSQRLIFEHSVLSLEFWLEGCGTFKRWSLDGGSTSSEVGLEVLQPSPTSCLSWLLVYWIRYSALGLDLLTLP